VPSLVSAPVIRPCFVPWVCGGRPRWLLSLLLSKVSVVTLQEALRSFAQHLLSCRGQKKEELVIAVEGKSLRGVHESAEDRHVLPLFATELLLSLDQATAGRKEDERGALSGWLKSEAETFLWRKLFTGEALFANRTLCQALGEAGGKSLWRLKQTNPSSMRR